MPKALSNYRQVRLTVSEGHDGAVVYRVMVKPLNQDWRTTHSVAHGRFHTTESTSHWSELLTVAATELLAQRLFPED